MLPFSSTSTDPYISIQALLSEKGVIFKCAGNPINIRQNRLRRPIIDLCEVPEKSIETVLHCLGFYDAALEKIYTNLGQGHPAHGQQIVHEQFKQRAITVERIGFSKKDPTSPKFYIVIHPAKFEGTYHLVHRGYNDKGLRRAIHIARKIKPLDLALAEQLSHRNHPCSALICRLKHYELGVKVSEHGGEDLQRFRIELLSNRERLGFYLTLLRNLVIFHQSGLVHRDIKLENIVVIRNASQEIVELKLIDLDSLAQNRTRAPLRGTPHYFSFDCLRELQNSVTTEVTVDQQEDIWAMMVIFCGLERRAILNNSENTPLIHRPLLDYYLCHMEQADKLWETSSYAPLLFAQNMVKRLSRQPWPTFSYDIPSQGPLNSLIWKMGQKFNFSRPSAQELLNGLDLNCLFPEPVDSK